MLPAVATPREARGDRTRTAAIDPRGATVDAGGREPIVPVDEIEAAYLRHATALLRYLYARTGRVQDAEDLLGDVFVQAWRYRGRVTQIDHWLYTVARHGASRLLGRRGREMPMEDVPDGTGISDGAGMLAGPPNASTEAEREAFDPAAPEIIALHALSDADREILMLHGQAGRPMAEVARILAISEAAAWQRWQRARDRYSAQLVAVGVHPPDGWRKPRRTGSGANTVPVDTEPASQEDAHHDL